VFTNKIGPLPMWAWVGIAAAILVIWRMFAAKQSASAAASTAATDSTAANTVPQFVNQVYTSGTAPHMRHGNSGAAAGTTGSTTSTGTTSATPITGWANVLAASGAPAPTPTAAPAAPTVPQQTTRPASTLGSVTGLRATGEGATNVGLAWNPVSGAQQYQVRVTYQNKVVKTAMTNGTSYNVTGLSPNRTYGLHVVAINGSDWAPETSISQKTT
jgi:hypothetical protein